MSTSTTNLNLVKPSGNEHPDVDVINGNMDILDAKIGAVGSTDLQAQVTACTPHWEELSISSQTITAHNDASRTIPTVSGYIPVAAAFYNTVTGNTGYVCVSLPQFHNNSWKVRIVNYTAQSTDIVGTLKVMYMPE